MGSTSVAYPAHSSQLSPRRENPRHSLGHGPTSWLDQDRTLLRRRLHPWVIPPFEIRVVFSGKKKKEREKGCRAANTDVLIVTKLYQTVRMQSTGMGNQRTL